MSKWNGLGIRVVDSGTEIRMGDRLLTVTDSDVVVKGATIYMTERHLTKIRTEHAQNGNVAGRVAGSSERV